MAHLGLVYTINAAHSGMGSPTHGHSFKIEVVFEGPIRGGTVEGLDFHEIRDRVANVINPLDKGYLNDVIDNPTVEGIACHILEGLKGLPVYSAKVWETADRYAEVFASDLA